MSQHSRQQRRAAAKRKKQQQRIMLLVGAVGIIFLLIAVGIGIYAESPPIVNANDEQQVAMGKQVYDQQCATCHGVDLEGEENWQEAGDGNVLKAPPHDETGHTWHHNTAYLLDSVREGGMRLPTSSGVSPMPAYKNILTEEEIAASIAYIQSRWPPEIKMQQAQR